jgi:hypothetical protein
VTVVLTFVALFGAGEQEDRGNRWVLIAFGVPMILIAFLPAYTDRKDLFTFNGDAIRWLGVVLFTAGGALRLWPVFVLGPRFSGLVAPDPLIAERNSSLDDHAALRRPANTSCGAAGGRSHRAEIFHLLGVGLRCYHAYAQRPQAFPYRISLALRH